MLKFLGLIFYFNVCVMCFNYILFNLIRCKLRKYLSYLLRVLDDILLLYLKVNIC